jgi:hypothetical protein
LFGARPSDYTPEQGERNWINLVEVSFLAKSRNGRRDYQFEENHVNASGLNPFAAKRRRINKQIGGRHDVEPNRPNTLAHRVAELVMVAE